METFIITSLFILGITIFMSIFIKPSKQTKKEQPHKPTQEEFDKVMKMLMVHGIITNSEYAQMYGRGRAFTKKS